MDFHQIIFLSLIEVINNMYIPLDPNKLEGCWEKLKKSLSSNVFSCSIHDGKNYICAKNSSDFKRNIEDIIDKMEKADYVRLGSNKMNFIPVHFAVNFLDYGKARLVELINSDNSKDTLKNDLALVIQFVFFDNKNLKELIIPAIVYGIDDPDVKIKIDEENHQMIINRITV